MSAQREWLTTQCLGQLYASLTHPANWIDSNRNETQLASYKCAFYTVSYIAWYVQTRLVSIWLNYVMGEHFLGFIVVVTVSVFLANRHWHTKKVNRERNNNKQEARTQWWLRAKIMQFIIHSFACFINWSVERLNICKQLIDIGSMKWPKLKLAYR